MRPRGDVLSTGFRRVPQIRCKEAVVYRAFLLYNKVSNSIFISIEGNAAMKRAYLDNSATTAVCRAADSMFTKVWKRL